jgi:hypothetical protein
MGENILDLGQAGRKIMKKDEKNAQGMKKAGHDET